MDPRIAAPTSPDPDAVEFVRFCYRRRRVGWPELYDEMCAVAHRGLFRGYGCDDLAAHGIGFALFDMPRLAVLAARVVEEEKAARRPMQVLIEGPAADDAAPTAAQAIEGEADAGSTEPSASPAHQVRVGAAVEPAGGRPYVRLAVAAGA